MASVVCGNHQCGSNFTLCFEQQHTSPLHIAVLNNHTEVVRLLIDAECDLDISDNVSNVSTLYGRYVITLLYVNILCNAFNDLLNQRCIVYLKVSVSILSHRIA